MQARRLEPAKTKLKSSQERNTNVHTHGLIYPELFSTDRGLYAVKWSLPDLWLQPFFRLLFTGVQEAYPF